MHRNWIGLGEQALWELVGAPNQGSVAEWTLLILAAIALVLVFARVSQIAEITRGGPGYSLVAVTIGVLSLIGAWWAMDGWLLPLTGHQLPRPVMRGLAVVVSLGVSVPLMCLVLRTRLRNVLAAWGGGLLAAMVLLWLGHLSVEAITAGSESAVRTKARSEEMQEFLNDQ